MTRTPNHHRPAALLIPVFLALAVAAGALRPATARAGGSRAATPTIHNGPADVYTDAHGDNASAPDIEKVTLTDGGEGTVAVEIDLAAALLTDGSSVVFGIDADRNAKT